MCCGKRRYTAIKDADDMGTGVFDKSLSCFGCGLGCFLLEFVFPPVWYYATFLYFGKYYRRDPRERAGLAASPITEVTSYMKIMINIIEVQAVTEEVDRLLDKVRAYYVSVNGGMKVEVHESDMTAKLFMRKEGAYREFLDATDFSLVGGDINGDGSFRRHLR
ncbi:hypothetical protein Bca4012_006836 [Brassica carinata]|uniref:BnaCnng45220D protein n=2 Tax=Brassica napus TaxID=3708 RepID=A0A078JB95_BRANA|nr:BnaCnng45220D [Brassica napus]